MQRSTLFILALIVSSFPMYAQVTRIDSFPVRSLNEVVIQQDRLPMLFSKQNRNIILLDKEVIKTLPVKSVNELLTYVSGVDVRQRGLWGAQADISIDGGTFDQTLVLINGIKITDPQTGHNMMNIPVSVSAIERIEILKGAAARIYGINALNGVINIITKKPEGNGVSLHAFAGSSFQKDTSNQKLFGGAGLDATVNMSGKKVNHLLSMGYTQTSGYRYNTALKNGKAFYQNNIDLGNNKTLSFLGGFVSNDFGANAFYAAPADKETHEKGETAIAGAYAVLPINNTWTVKPRISYRYNHDDYIFIRQKPEVYRNRHATNVLDMELNNTFFTGIGNFGLGAEVRNEAINSNSLGRHNRMNYGFFSEYSFNKVKDLLVNIGAYTNYNSDFGWEFLPGIDAGYTIKKNVRVFANAGTGQRLPTYTDLYYKGPSNIGNDQLQPEHSTNVEAGVKYNSTALNASASYFYRNTSDFIDWVKDSLNQPWQPQNFSKIKTRGLSFSADYRLLNAEDAGDFSLLTGLSYTWLNPKVSHSGKSNKISQYALENLRNQLTARASLAFVNKYHLTLAARYQQRVHYKDYTLLDARVAVTCKKFEFYSDLSNITNVSYIEAGAVPMVGRWFTAGVKWSSF
jgi:iron complex outermembrane receptor protein